MTRLSVNLNKVALLRNSRETTIPDVVAAAITAIDAGAQGITVHPRPDQRHIRPDDVYALAELLSARRYQDIEFNIEGNPYAGPEANGYPGFMALVTSVKPHQATLVPDDPGQLTSDHGWNLTGESNRLKPLVEQLQTNNCRVSCFMDSDLEQLTLAQHLGADRIEFYTGPYAEAYAEAYAEERAEESAPPPAGFKSLNDFVLAGEHASRLGLGINAGHDLNLRNLATFCNAVPNVAEVSIGHAIISDALWSGLADTVARYRHLLDSL